MPTINTAGIISKPDVPAATKLVPEIVAWPFSAGHLPYLDWIDEATAPPA